MELSIVQCLNKCVICISVCMFCSVALGQSRSFGGTWIAAPRADQDQPSLTLVDKPGGTLSLNTSALIFQFRCDGKRYPIFNRLLGKETGEGVCTLMTASELDVSYGSQDKPLGGFRLQVSGDRQSLTYTTRKADGENRVKVVRYARVSGTNSLLGGWKTDDPTDVLRIAIAKHAVTIDFPHAHEIGVLPISGAEVHIKVDGVMSKDTQTLDVENNRKLRVVTRAGGVAIQQATFTISDDGKTLTENGWLQQHPEDSATYSYHRSN